MRATNANAMTIVSENIGRTATSANMKVRPTGNDDPNFNPLLSDHDLGDKSMQDQSYSPLKSPTAQSDMRAMSGKKIIRQNTMLELEAKFSDI